MGSARARTGAPHKGVGRHVTGDEAGGAALSSLEPAVTLLELLAAAAGAGFVAAHARHPA